MQIQDVHKFFDSSSLWGEVYFSSSWIWGWPVTAGAVEDDAVSVLGLASMGTDSFYLGLLEYSLLESWAVWGCFNEPKATVLGASPGWQHGESLWGRRWGGQGSLSCVPAPAVQVTPDDTEAVWGRKELSFSVLSVESWDKILNCFKLLSFCLLRSSR